MVVIPRKRRPMMQRMITLMCCVAATALAGCTTGQIMRPISSSDTQTFLLDERDFGVTARDLAQVADITSLASRIDAVNPATPVPRRLVADFLPLISRSPAGRRFLGMTEGRALAIGDPGASCPALESGEGTDAAEAAGAAMRRCLDRLDARVPEADCACRLLAVNDT